MARDDEQQYAARLRMENAYTALDAYVQKSQAGMTDPEFLQKLREEFLAATENFFGKSKAS